MSADLIAAAKAGDAKKVQSCLDAGAGGKRNEALMEAARCGHAEVAALLLERGANASYGSKPCGIQRCVGCTAGRRDASMPRRLEEI